MPGLTNRRNAIREGSDWTKSKTKGYKYGGKVKGPVIAGGATEIPGVGASITKASISPVRKKKSRKV